MIRRARRAFAPPALALGLALIAAPLARAQEEAPLDGEQSEGKPLYAYVATAFLACAPVFILCKSARR